ncbi:hypothetical protein Hamer_G005874 [Homarus americanus]|uniref:Uncharacterized protein n=1 Tax=Homarus americanus TaxID=6706 RepID=A0A8J5JK87_HOMAM|nr:hypothetical protein Hamer_G005874 [Homarus americanus]
MTQKSEMWHLQPKSQDRKCIKNTRKEPPRQPSAQIGKKHHAWSTSCPERRDRMKVAMAKIQPQNTTEAPQSTFLPCTSPTRLQDKIEDTGTKSVHGGNHDKSVDSTMAAPELYSSKSTEHSSIGLEHHIAWHTASPSGDRPPEYTPACQSTSGIHRRTNKTDDRHYRTDFLYNNKETR